ISVIVTAAPRMGMPAAAVSASKLIHNFRPRFIAITGICAGIRGKTEIGDILIADPCFDWGGGKWVANAKSDLQFHAAPYQWRLDESLRAAAKSMAVTPNLMSNVHTEYSKTKPTHPPTVFIDAMASGASVLQASAVIEDVRDQHKNLIGIEMESYAVF